MSFIIERIAIYFEFYRKDILKEAESIENGLGVPNWQLVICLIIAWCIIGLVLIKGIQSSGKVCSKE